MTGASDITGLFEVRDGRALGVIPPIGGKTGRGFGGHIGALAMMAAYQCVPEAMSIHHLHLEFLRPARVGAPVDFAVRQFADGRSIARRLVDVSHGDEPPIATMMCTFNEREPTGPQFQLAIPDVPPPDQVPVSRTEPVEVRRQVFDGDDSRQLTWIRPAVRPIRASQALHNSVLMFMSDYTILWPTMAVHGLNPLVNRHFALGTVSHTMWFHREVHADQWFLYDQRTPSTSDGLGHAEGRIFTQDGLLIASVSQVGLLRPRKFLERGIQ